MSSSLRPYIWSSFRPSPVLDLRCSSWLLRCCAPCPSPCPSLPLHSLPVPLLPSSSPSSPTSLSRRHSQSADRRCNAHLHDGHRPRQGLRARCADCQRVCAHEQGGSHEIEVCFLGTCPPVLCPVCRCLLGTVLADPLHMAFCMNGTMHKDIATGKLISHPIHPQLLIVLSAVRCVPVPRVWQPTCSTHNRPLNQSDPSCCLL